MKILALETTERIGSLAIAKGSEILCELTLDAKLRTAQSLVPGISQALGEVGWKPDEIQLVALTIGPGSFTGLRLGLTTAKTFAYAVGAEILGIDTLEAIAAGVPEEVEQVAVAIDAQRGQLAAGVLRRAEKGRFTAEDPMRLVDADAWLASLPSGIALAGPILKRLKPRIPAGLNTLDPEFWYPKASTVARLASADYAAGRRDDLWQLAPRYSRKSAAEEKLL